MGAETKGCAKGLFPLFWGAVVIGLATFGWVLFNKGALAFLVGGGGPKTEAVQIAGQPGNQQMSQPGAQNQGMMTPVGGMRWVGGMNPAQQQGNPSMQNNPQMMGVAGSSVFGAIIPRANQVVVNISATSQLPVGHPQAQGNENALAPQEKVDPMAPNQNPEQVGNTPPSGDLTFVDPFSGPTVESIGSGAIVCPHGHILTNYHVIERATSIFVTTYVNGTRSRLPATVQKADKTLDLAILKIDSNNKLPFAPLANSDAVQVGDPVIAIGSPWGLSQTVTQGIVSAKRQTITIQGVRHADLLQTDASINRGNSGGPLINDHGEIVGINTAIFTTNGGFSGVGFAIPANTAKQFLTDAGVVLPEPMMAQANAMNANADRRMGMNGANGMNGGNAMNGNMAKAQPVLFGLNFGQAPTISCDAPMPHPFWGDCADCHKFNDAPCAVNPMDRVLKARGQPAAFMNVTMMGSGTNNAGGGNGVMSGFPAVPSNFGATNFVGMNIQEVNPIAARQFDVNPNRGVLVRTVSMNSPAMQAKLLPGDIILKVNGRAIDGPKTFHKMIHKTKKGVPIRIFYMRKGVRLETEISVGGTPTTLNQVFPQPTMGMGNNMMGMGMGQNNMGMMNNQDNRKAMRRMGMGNNMMGQNMAPMGNMNAITPVNQDRRRGLQGNGGMQGNMGMMNNQDNRKAMRRMGNNNMMGQNNMGMGQNIAAMGMAPVNQNRMRGMQGNGQVNINNLNDTNWMGMDLDLLTPRRAMQLGLSGNTQGLRVKDVNNNSMALMAGVQNGDIIKSINNIRIVDASSAVKALNAAMAGNKSELEIQRFNMVGLVVLG
jgi:S1-C subfamily serine protease